MSLEDPVLRLLAQFGSMLERIKQGLGSEE